MASEIKVIGKVNSPDECNNQSVKGKQSVNFVEAGSLFIQSSNLDSSINSISFIKD